MAELVVSRKTVSKILTEMQGRKFIIPDFQRPYKWDIEKCETLWNDILNFKSDLLEKEDDYFLGTIVTFLNEDKNQEIIDGQQRITSFLLLLRAFYKKLEGMEEDEKVRGLKNQIAPCIWDIDPISQVVSNSSAIHIKSLVATAEDNDLLLEILRTGNCEEVAKDNYSENFRFFKKACDSYAEREPLKWMELCITILNKCIVLPIECNTSEMALTIFSTLNDRGLPLADSDIFKAQIYRSIEGAESRKLFSSTWKELTEVCNKANLSIDDIFRYYSHALRAANADSTKEVGLRKFYSENKYSKLREPDLMQQILRLARFWVDVNNPNHGDENGISFEARKYLHCLEHYPNEFWKFPISVFYLKNSGNNSFQADFASFLEQLVRFLFAKFIISPTVNAIKDDIYKACIAIAKGERTNIFAEIQRAEINEKIETHSSSRLSRSLLLLHAYLDSNQLTLIPTNFDIEHIFPQKWQDTNYFGWDEKDAQSFLNKFGNKMVLEKKLNIQAGNGYFGKKKEKYSRSDIAVVNRIADSDRSDWAQTDIQARDDHFVSAMLTFFGPEGIRTLAEV